MKFVKTISMLVALLILAGTFAACGAATPSTSDTTSGDTSGGETTTEAVTTADPLAEPELPDIDTEGYNFRIVTRVEGWGIYNNEHLIVDEANGEILNDALYKRRVAAEDKFGITISEIVETGGESSFKSIINKTVMANEDAYDVLVPTYDPKLGPEFLVDFNTIDCINLDKPWWNQNYIEATSVNGKLVSAVNSLMITHMDSVLAMFYNQKLATDFKLPDLYEIVRKGEWTLPKFFEITKDTTLDLDGDGQYTDSDQYTFVGLDGIQRLGSGVQINSCIKDSNDIPILNLDSEKTMDALASLREYAANYEREIYNPRKDKNGGGDGDKAVFRLFQNDQALFYVHGLGSAQMFRNMKSDFGILPTPKLDETQENYYVAPDTTKLLMIPITVPDVEKTAMILEYLAWYGYTEVRPLYYESMLQSKYLRDEESVEMMDEYIYTNIGFGPVSGSTHLTTVVNSIINGSSEIASTIAGAKERIESQMVYYIEQFE